jgi:hypothetical protein
MSILLDVVTGALGYLSKINSKGDAEGNFSLIVCKEMAGEWKMKPIGNFRLNFDSDEIPVSPALTLSLT